MKVLLADDSQLIREMVKESINNFDDFTLVDTVSNGEEAISRYQDINPDIVLFDVEMPKVNGKEVAEQLGIRGEYSLIFLSGDDFEVQGNEKLIQKPVDNDKLNQVLQNSKSEIQTETDTINTNQGDWDWD